MQANFLRSRIYFTVIITLAIWGLLAWNYLHGGVPSHHILAREDMPSISNWWGGLLLPVLTWFLLYRAQKRLNLLAAKKSMGEMKVKVAIGFGVGLLFGLLLSIFFVLGISELPGYMILSVFIGALFFPVYRAECLLGFVIGMTYTFGAVLPTAIGSMLALVGALIYLLIRPAMLFVISKFNQSSKSDKHSTN
jgi:MFS family permease